MQHVFWFSEGAVAEGRMGVQEFGAHPGAPLSNEPWMGQTKEESDMELLTLMLMKISTAQSSSEVHSQRVGVEFFQQVD